MCPLRMGPPDLFGRLQLAWYTVKLPNACAWVRPRTTRSTPVGQSPTRTCSCHWKSVTYGRSIWITNRKSVQSRHPDTARIIAHPAHAASTRSEPSCHSLYEEPYRALQERPKTPPRRTQRLYAACQP